MYRVPNWVLSLSQCITLLSATNLLVVLDMLTVSSQYILLANACLQNVCFYVLHVIYMILFFAFLVFASRLGSKLFALYQVKTPSALYFE